MTASSGGRARWVLAIAGVQLAALVVTFFIPGLGDAWWHHIASLAFVLALVWVVRHRMRSRRFLAIGVLSATILATLSGFYLLYWKEGIRIDGYQDWGVFWHVLWSWAAAVFFWQHTWVNRVAFAHFFRRSLGALKPAAVHLGLYAVALAALAVTWGPAKGFFTVENYIPLSYATWLVVTLGAYGAWLLLRRRDRAGKKRVRGSIDLGLVPIAALAVVSGLPLLFFDPATEAAGLKYASKFWHVWPSTVFAVLVFVHGVQTWNTVRVHWQRLGSRSRAAPTASVGPVPAAAPTDAAGAQSPARALSNSARASSSSKSISGP